MGASEHPPAPAAITPESAYRSLKAHRRWIVERDRLRCDLRLRNFTAAVELIDRLAEVAERLGHHPNIRLHEWCFVELEVYSHVSGGLTTRDVDLALALDEVIAGQA